MYRRNLWRWLTLAMLATLASAAAMPTTASASTCNPDGTVCSTFEACAAGTIETGRLPGGAPVCVRTAGLNHVGWTYLNLNYCPPGRFCAEIFRESMIAWSWTGRAWTQTSLRQGWVYVYPYTGQWRWAYTQQTGWVAVTGGQFQIHPY